MFKKEASETDKKVIDRKIIERKVKKAFKEGRDWCRHDFGRYFKIMIDVDDAEIWSDVFLSVNSWKEYHSDTVKYLQCDTPSSLVKDMEKTYIENAITQLEHAGWTVGGCTV